jgi:hypothetical protein
MNVSRLGLVPVVFAAALCSMTAATLVMGCGSSSHGGGGGNFVTSPSPSPSPSGSTPSITTSTLPSGYFVVNGSTVPPYASDAFLAATGGTPPYSWSSTSLPSGLTVTNTGQVMGTATAAGGSPLFTVTDARGGQTLSDPLEFA